jgi:uncharacterized membrane protein
MALAELRGHWKTAIFAYVLYSVLFTLPAALLNFIFVGVDAETLTSLIAVGGDGGMMLNSLPDADLGALAEQRARASISLLYLLIIEGPLFLGISGFVLAASRGAIPGPGAVLDGFNNFFRAAGTYLLIGLRMFLWCLPVILVISLLFTASLTMSIGNLELFMAPSLLALLPLFLIIALAAVIIRVTLTYAQAFFLLVDNSHQRVRDALRQSRNMMFGNKKKLMFLNLSFIGWYILLYVVLTIITSVFDVNFPFIARQFALPVLNGIFQAPVFIYVMVSGAVFYDIITGRRRSWPAEGAFFTDGPGTVNGDEASRIAAGRDREERDPSGNAGEDR